jgi:hypothetical protein
MSSEQSSLKKIRHTVKASSLAQSMLSPVAENPDQMLVPVAFVIATHTENHDIFKDILLALFEDIKVSKTPKKLAFAQLTARIAFLRTIPTPSPSS